MAVDTYDPITGRPIFLDGGAPDIAVDPTEVGKYAAEVGNRIVGTTAYRDGYPYKRKGLRAGDTTTNKEYEYTGEGWVVVGGPTLTAPAPTMAANWSWGSGSKITRAGDVVTVHALLVRSSVIAGAQAVLTLPVGFRPTDAVAAAGALVTGGAEGAVTVTVTSAGTMTIVHLTGGASLSMRLDFSFPAA